MAVRLGTINRSGDPHIGWIFGCAVLAGKGQQKQADAENISRGCTAKPNPDPTDN